MTYADSSYYIVEFDGRLIPKTKANHFCKMASYCISYYLPRNYKYEEDDKIKRGCCRIAEILYGYCKENKIDIRTKKEIISLMFCNKQIEIQIRNTIILYLKINVLQKTE